MFVTRTVNYGWHTIRESYHVTCKTCGLKYKRTASTGFNDLATPEDRTKYRQQLKVDAARYSEAPFTCNKCKRAKIVESGTIIEPFTPELFAEIKSIASEQQALNARKIAVRATLRKHRGRIFTYQGDAYAQDGDYFNDEGELEVYGRKISKNAPWETTDKDIYAPIHEITYFDDTLQERQAKTKGHAQ